MKQRKIIRIFFSLLLLFLSAACATNTRIERLGAGHEPKWEGCQITFYRDTKPSKPYETLGKIESHIQKNFFFGGKVQLEDEVYAELRQKACSLGGEAVLIDDCVSTAASEVTHIHVWATVIRFTK
jgi:hypothetical protein